MMWLPYKLPPTPLSSLPDCQLVVFSLMGCGAPAMAAQSPHVPCFLNLLVRQMVCLAQAKGEWLLQKTDIVLLG